MILPSEIALLYHARTKHRAKQYAAGPETVDWDAQPNPFRVFEGSPRIKLPVVAHRLQASFAALHQPGAIAPAVPGLESVAALLELSMGLTAWKTFGPDRWALRSNPSSGNLHPTETYVLARQIPGLADGLYHYASQDHTLEQRATLPPGEAGLWIGLSSIHWREAWKYGERGFRYCQLDIGHAAGALRYAAAALGWRAELSSGLDSDRLATLLGLDRAADFAGAEPEEAELLIALGNAAAPPQGSGWIGQANQLDPRPMYDWPVIEEAAAATRGVEQECAQPPVALPVLAPAAAGQAAGIILNRRSGQRFDPKFVLPQADFFGLLDSLLPRPQMPWDIWRFSPLLHPVIFVHRVAGIAPGLYALPRSSAAQAMMREIFRPEFLWGQVEGAPDHLPLFQLSPGDFRVAARALNCHQAIAAESCFTLCLLSEFGPVVRRNSWRYRQLHWEAGLLGQILYLQAEAISLRGTGIGCFFDDATHELLGIRDDTMQSLYHFTIGRPMIDERITTEPGYAARPMRLGINAP